MKNFKIKIFCCLVFVSILCFNSTCVYSAKKIKETEPIEIEVPSFDGFYIAGNLDLPTYATVSNKAPLVIFLHSLGATSISWGNYPRKFKKLGMATLTIDLRGHGKSIKNKDNKNKYWQHFKTADFKKYPKDITSVLKYLKEEYPEVDTSNVAIVGSSLGATTALMTAISGEPIKTVVLISPMLEYKGFDLRLPIVKYGEHPILFLTSKKDRYSFDSCEELIKFAQGKKMLKSYPNGGHGLILLKFQPESEKTILNWVKTIIVKEKKINEKPKKKKSKRIKPLYKEYTGKIKKSGDLHRSLH